MSVQIENSGTSLKISSEGQVRFINKNLIGEVSVVREDTVKLDIGQGVLNNIFLLYSDVSIPATANVSALRDAIHSMLQTTAMGMATEQKQIEQKDELQLIKAKMDELKSKVDTVNEKLFYDPLLMDESNPLVIYKGYANVGSATNQPIWAIQRISKSMSITTYKWADGNKNFDNVWDNRASLVYS